MNVLKDRSFNCSNSSQLNEENNEFFFCNEQEAITKKMTYSFEVVHHKNINRDEQKQKII